MKTITPPRFSCDHFRAVALLALICLGLGGGLAPAALGQTDRVPDIKMVSTNEFTINLQPSRTAANLNTFYNFIKSGTLPPSTGGINSADAAYSGSPEPSITVTSPTGPLSQGFGTIVFLTNHIGSHTYTVTAKNVAGMASTTFTVEVKWNAPDPGPGPKPVPIPPITNGFIRTNPRKAYRESLPPIVRPVRGTNAISQQVQRLNLRAAARLNGAAALGGGRTVGAGGNGGAAGAGNNAGGNNVPPAPAGAGN